MGIPLGLLLFRGAIQADGSQDDFSYPVWWWLVPVAPGAVLLVLALACNTAPGGCVALRSLSAA